MSLDAHNRPLKDWLYQIGTRRVVLPRFQRLEAWSNAEIADLILTVLRGLPAGSLLIQKVEGNPLFHWRALQSAPQQGDHISALLLDGQQRLTALWRSLNDNYDNRTFFVSLPDGKFDQDAADVRSVGTAVRSGVRFPQWAGQPEECWKRSLVPVWLLNPERTGAEVNKWAREAAADDFGVAMEIAGEVNELRGRVSGFNLPYLELPASTPREVVLGVFVKLNTRSVRLTAFDIIVAEVEALDESLHALVENIKHRVPRLLAYDESPEDTLLSVACLLQDRPPNQSGYFGLDLAQLVSEWDVIERGVEDGIRFLEEERVFDALRLPTEAPLAPLFALWALAPEQPDKLGAFRHLAKRYLWRAFFTDRYERAAATAALQDFRALRAVLEAGAPESRVPIFDGAAHPLPTADMLAGAGWPRGRSRLARAVLLLSLRGAALDVADAAPLSRDHVLKREYHHLYPVAYLHSLGRPEEDAMRALNCALISWRTNRTLSAKPPRQYLEERIKAAPGDALPAEDAVRHRLATHGIDFDALSADDYDAFLAARRDWAVSGITALCEGQPWPP